jgi:hypothetical protein
LATDGEARDAGGVEAQGEKRREWWRLAEVVKGAAAAAFYTREARVQKGVGHPRRPCPQWDTWRWMRSPQYGR